MRAPPPPLLLALLLLAQSVPPAAMAQTVQRGSHGPSAAPEPIVLASPLPGGRLTSAFGLRKHPILGATMMHEGIDLAAPTGTPIRAAAPGRIVEAGYEAGYGKFVQVRHGERLESLYGHMSRIAATAGQTVSAGEILGFVGSTGLANGPHLHFEVRRDGIAVDPAAWAAMPSHSPASRRSQVVEVVRGGRSAEATGGPRISPAGVQVVRGGR